MTRKGLVMELIQILIDLIIVLFLQLWNEKNIYRLRRFCTNKLHK